VSTPHQLDGATWRFMTWNLDWWRRHDQRVPRTALLAEQAATVVALQEVSGEVAKTLRAHHPGEALFSQELHPGATWRLMGCGLLLPPQATVLSRGVVRSLPKPQRGIYAVVQLPGQQPMTFVSWHTPNAAGDGREVKMRSYVAMTEWLAAATTPVVLGADLNTWIDPVDLRAANASDPFYEEHAFVGQQPAHGLVDAYRAVLESQGALARLREERPDGPLAVSHELPSGAQHRMDRVYASPGLQPVRAAYLPLDVARASGSDHAPLWVDFRG